MNQEPANQSPLPPWRILSCILLGSLFFALFFVTPALFHVPQIVMEDWRKVLVEIALLQVVLMGGGLFLIAAAFCRKWSSLWKCLVVALLIGGIAAFHPAILQLIQGERTVRGELRPLVVLDGKNSIVIDPNSKQARFLKKRGKASVGIIGESGKSEYFPISHDDAARIAKKAKPGDQVELRLLPTLKRLLEVKKLN